MKGRLFALILLAASTMTNCGCGDGAPADTREFGKLSGKVTVKGAPLPGGMQIVFLPATGQKGAFADIGADGTYSTEAVTGANQVYLVASVGADGKYVDPAAMGVLPQFLDVSQSGLTADAPAGGESKADFEVGQ